MPNEARDWYDERHRTRGVDAWRPRDAYRPFLEPLEPLRPGARLLDVGCGTGHLLGLATDRGLLGTGLDLSRYALRIVRESVPAAQVAMASGTDLPFRDGTFDYLTCIGVLEHFPDVRAGASELARVCAPGARACVVVPNVNYFEWRLRRRGGTEQQEIGELLLDLEGWREVLVSSGFRIRRIGQDRWPTHDLHIFASRNPLGIARRLTRRIAWALLPLRFTYQFVFALERP